MTDISVIILVGNEALHIQRCLERLAPLAPRQVFIVESQTGDTTHELAIETAKCLNWRIGEFLNGNHPNSNIRTFKHSPNSNIQTFSNSNISPTLITIFHPWPGLYAKQFNWALDNLPIASTWVLRLDADEYLTDETMGKLAAAKGLVALPDSVGGVTLELKRRFCGGEIRHATNGIRLLRIWRSGRGRSEERAMDEHIAIDGIEDVDELRRLGKVVDFDGAFYDDNLNDMDWWRAKHRGYAKREAADALAFARGEVHFKPMKERYYRMPRYLRALVYFAIRYFLKGGILDGYAGWMWNFCVVSVSGGSGDWEMFECLKLEN